MRILITGAAGFLGQHITHELEDAGHEVDGIDREDCDLLDPRASEWLTDRLGETTPDYLLHLAAKVGRQFGEDDPVRTIMDNVGMTTIVARACGDTGTALAYASTSEIYGDLGEQIAFERGPKRLPHNLYGLTKRFGEEVAELYAPRGLVC